MRNIKKREPKHVVCFIVDGETEKWYLKQMRTSEHLPIPIEPELLQDKALSLSFEEVKQKAADYDKVYWIVDMDDVINKGGKTVFINHYNKLKNMGNVEIIANVPCLEYWYLLHYTDTSKFFYSYNDMLPILQKYIPDYNKTEKYYKGFYEKLKPLLDTAITNSKRHKFDVSNMEQGVSEMWQIFEDLKIK